MLKNGSTNLMWRSIVLVIFSSVVAGCTLAKPIEPLKRAAVFDEAQYAPYKVEGPGRIEGQAFLKTRSGDVKYGAGCTVYLNPVTDYSTEWYEVSVVKELPIEDADPRTMDFHRSVIADGEGRFVFTNLPIGEYYLACNITWEYVSSVGRYGSSTSTTGGTAHARVSVSRGEVARAILTR